jgi:tRNA threonylcarbamoyladenosine biosynthesis protein TsaB
MNILALDTSAEACSVALNLDGEIHSRFEHAPRRHTELLLPMIERLLAEAGLKIGAFDAVAFGRGPGSFTGVRIAAGAAQGIAFGADLPVAPVSTLAALALRGLREEGERQLLPAFDARMGEVYWAIYSADDQGRISLLKGEMVCPPNLVSLPEGSGWHGVGDGWGVYKKELNKRVGDRLVSISSGLQCRADEIALLGAGMHRAGETVCAEMALPVYLRDEVAWKKSR